MNLAPLQGKVALVTGAARSIGRRLALSLAEAGASVAITWRDSQADADQTLADLRLLGVEAEAFRAELRDPAQIRAAVDAAAARFGRLDILVNNAGRFETAALEAITVEQWDAMFETTPREPFLAAQAVYPHPKASRGRIINIGSLGGLHPWPTHAHY